MSKPDKYHDCGHRLRCNDKRKRVQETPEPVVKESLTAQSKTPRTDAVSFLAFRWGTKDTSMVVTEEFAHQLETELAEANFQNELLRDCVKDGSVEPLMLQNLRLMREGNELRAQVERLRDAMTDLMDWAAVPDESYSFERWNKAVDKGRDALASTEPGTREGGE